MKPDEFRAAGHTLVDWVADYLERVGDLPVFPPIEPGWVRAQLPAHPPEHGEPWDEIVGDLDRVVVPGLTHWQSPNFFGFFPANASGPAILGDLVSSGLGVQGMLWATSPACTELETHVLDWLIELLGLPARFRSDGAGGGVIQDSASSANLCAVLAARDVHVSRAGSGGLERLRAYTSTQAHSSIEKAIRVAGLHPDQLRLVDVDANFAMEPAALASAIDDDVANGLVPFIVVGTVGTTSSLAIDPIDALADICGPRRHLAARRRGHGRCGRGRSRVAPAGERPASNASTAGASIPTSGCSPTSTAMCCSSQTADRLIQSLSVLPEYLRNQASESGAVIDYRDWHIPLGRRFRALKLWFVIRHYGAQGLRAHVEKGVAAARWLADKVDVDNRFERLVPTDLSLVCFAHRDGDDATEALHHEINASGRAYITHTRLDGRYAIRVAVGGTYTEQVDVERFWSLVESTS